MKRREIRVLPDPEAASRAAADEVVRRAEEAVRERGRFTLALAGGSTPRRLYQLLATELRHRIDWSRVHLFWGDERCVPPDDPRSNYRLARATLLDSVPVADEAVHRIRGELGPERAAADYHDRLARFFDRPMAGYPALDLAILGAGTDGHTASIFPGDVRPEDVRWARPARAPEGSEPVDRVTLTLRALDASRRALFLVTGEAKAAVVAEARADPPHAPAALVRPRGGALWLVDPSAAGDVDGARDADR